LNGTTDHKSGASTAKSAQSWTKSGQRRQGGG
jgi:hypothetical protein